MKSIQPVKNNLSDVVLASFSVWFTILVPVYPGCPGKEAMKRE